MRTLYSTPTRRLAFGVTVAVLFAALGLLGRAALSGTSDAATSGPTAAGASTLPAVASAPGDRGTPAGSSSADPSVAAVLGSLTQLPPHTSIVASARGASVALSHRLGGPPYRYLGSLPGSYGTPLAFLVLARRAGWAHVELPLRPNRSTAWIPLSQLHLAATQYHLGVELGRHRLTLWHGTREVLQAPIGVGRAVSPTPAGTYYLVYLLRPPDPHSVYGPYAFGLSAYSDVYTSFAGGDGEVGLHGTDDPAGLGHDVSHGCIRVANPVITRLAHLLPLGTPITVVH